MPGENVNNFSKLVAMFLSEIIRSRRTSIVRAAEISELVVENMNKISSETEALNLLTEIERDFEEVINLKQVLHFGYNETDIKVYEKEIKEFAAEIFVKDMVLSTNFLHDAATEGVTIQKLALKYPEFCRYMLCASDKGRLLEIPQAA